MPTVLIVDDEPSLRLLVRVALTNHQYRVLEAKNGFEAWDLLQTHRPAVVIMDVQMPGYNGFELTHAIREAPALADTCIVMLTARARSCDVAAGLAAGADLYLAKPFSPIALPVAIERALVKRRRPAGAFPAA